MRVIRSLTTAASALALLSACETAADPDATQSAAPAETSATQGGGAVEATGSEAAHDALWALFADADEDSLRRNPLSALGRGDKRYADRLGDYYSDAYFDAERKAAESQLQRLRAIDRAELSPTDRIAYDVFEYDQQSGLKDLAPDMLALTAVRPINHFYGLHNSYPVFASGNGAAPFETLEDYENNLKRHAQFVTLIDRAITRFREGLDTGVYATRLTTENVIKQLDGQLATPVQESPYFAPITRMPDSIAAADRVRLAQDYERVVSDDIYPALRRLRDFLANDYLPQARTEVGLSSMKGGRALYARMIEDSTTLPLSADELHQLGLREVARIKGEMNAIRQQVGFDGTLSEFFTFLRTDPRFAPKSEEEIAEGYREIEARVDARIDEQFSLTPKTPLEIRPVEAFRAATEAAGSYNSGTPDGSRPGVFYYNTYDLPTRYTWGMETLFLHEGEPGHHFQLSLAQENTDLPNFMRFGGNTAYVEGWALYAETLGPALGMYTDPYQKFGNLNDEQLRAMRLVVDTGIHAKGWTRQQAIDFMTENSSLGPTDIIAEVERYIAIPGQALAYKVGALKIQELKAKAMTALGDRFDPREFHAQVLDTGALPLPILEKKIDDWIASKG